MKNKIRKRILINRIILLICIIPLSLGTTACSEDKKDIPDVPITGEWAYYSIEGSGMRLNRILAEDRNHMPMFHSEDGKTFSLTINGERFYEGKLILNEDGTYTLIYGEDKDPLYASIKGDELTITKPGKIKIVFLGDDE